MTHSASGLLLIKALRSCRSALARRPTSALAVSALSSLGNFAITIAIARTSSVHEVGQYAIAFSAYFLATGLAQAAVAESAIATHRTPADMHDALARCLLLVLVPAPVVLGVAIALDQPYLGIMAAALPGMVLYDHVRVLQLTLARPLFAVLQETVWTAVSFLAAYLGVTGRMSGLAVFGVWAISGSVIGVVDARIMGFTLRPRWTGGTSEGTVATFYGLDFVAGSGTAQLSLFSVAAVAGTAVVGAVRAGATLFSPLNLIVTAARPLVIRKLALDRRRGPEREVRAAILVSSTVAGLSLLALVGALLIPASIGRLFLGASWAPAAPLILPLGLEAVTKSLTSMSSAGHRAHRAAARVMTLSIILAPVRIVVVLLFAAHWGASGAAWGMVTISAIGAVVWWASYLNSAKGKPSTEPEAVSASSEATGSP